MIELLKKGKVTKLGEYNILSGINYGCTAAAAAAAKSLQSCLILCDPIDGSPPGSPVPGILQARILEWVAILQLCSSLSTLWHCLSLGFIYFSF